MIMKNGKWILKNISDRENLSSQRNLLRGKQRRANYNDLGKGISATTFYLERFLKIF